MSDDQQDEAPKVDLVEKKPTTTLEQLMLLNDSVTGLGTSVQGLSDQFKEFVAWQAKQDALAAKNKRFRVATIIGASFMALVIGALIIFGVWVSDNGDDTRQQFNDYKSQAVSNCGIRNEQADANRTLFTFVLTLFPKGVSAQNDVVHDQLAKYVSTIPANYNCALLNLPPQKRTATSTPAKH